MTPRLCPGVAESDGCGLAAEPGDRYCPACRDAVDRFLPLWEDADA